jgi:outer membrane protein assembly factor BamD
MFSICFKKVPYMLRVKFSHFMGSAFIAVTLLLTACSSTPVDKTATMSPNAIYAEAKDEMANVQWEKAIPLLEKLEARAAGTPLAQQAQLDKAYAYYKSGEPAQALATLERFIKLHPASVALDYALYLKAIVNFNDDLGLFSSISQQDLAERDQKAAKESFESFKELVSRFPDSKYSIDARQRMTYIVNSLAQYEVYVARYYFKRGAYLAAANRAQIAITDYSGAPATEESLFILYKSYDALGMNDLRDDTKRVLTTNFPESEFLLTGSKAEQASPWWKLW